MTSLAASVDELMSEVREVPGVGRGSLVPVSLVRPRSVLVYQRCSSRPFRGCRSAWSEGRLRLKNPHLYKA